MLRIMRLLVLLAMMRCLPQANNIEKDIFVGFAYEFELTQCNEILAAARMKSADADEIFGFASDEIKSTHPPSRRISSNEVGFHRRRRFHSPARVDFIEKDLVIRQGLFLVRVAGLEPV